MILKTIDDKTWPIAIDLLAEGFPDFPRSYWEDVLTRFRHIKSGDPWPVGYLLGVKGVNVGVLLAFGSERGDGQPILNLSSWYIQESHRLYALAMLRKLIREQNAVLTSLTPSTSVITTLVGSKFEPWNEGVLFTSLPQACLKWRSDARIVDASGIDDHRLSADDRQLLKDHARIGCLFCFLEVNGKIHPLVFVRRFNRKVRYAHLIYAPSRKTVLKHLARLCLFLLRQGYFALSVDCFKDQVPKGSIFVDGSHRFLLGAEANRGGVDSDRIDYAYSELVLFERYHSVPVTSMTINSPVQKALGE